MYLGIEIGGTKLQLGVGQGDGSPLIVLERRQVDPQAGAKGILLEIERMADILLAQHKVAGVGIGFGGPVDRTRGLAVKSHQIEGWDNFALCDWFAKHFGLPTAIANDCDAAALAEARFGAGRNSAAMLFVTVGTGIGGGLVFDGKLYGGSRPAVAEIGHLRPGIVADQAGATVESIASGRGIAEGVAARFAGNETRSFTVALGHGGRLDREAVRERLAEAEQLEEEALADLRVRCDGDIEALSTKIIAQAASEGNAIACEAMQRAIQMLGWAIAQAVTLIAPEIVVVGGGVSLAGDILFLDPLRREVARYVFPPLAESVRIVPAQLGELVVVHGALAMAAT
jgi:glucokinase